MAKKKARLRMGVIGVGGMGTGHCRTMKKVKEMKLVAVCDIDVETVDRVSSDFGVPGFKRHKDLIKSGLCDAVIVATPHPSHPPIAIDCMKAGIDVLSEKPLSERISTSEKMVKVAKKTKRVLAVMFQHRFKGDNGHALEIAASGALGKIHRTSLIGPMYRSQAYYDSGGWRATWTEEGGGVLINQAPHVMDLFVNLAGMPEKVRGKIETRLHKIEVEDVAEATLTYKGGGIGYLYCATTEPGGDGGGWEIFGDKGKLVCRGGKVHYYKFSEPISKFTKRNKEPWGKIGIKEVPLRQTPPSPGHVYVMRNFARHILRGDKLLCSATNGLGQIELANAIIMSGVTGREVKLPLSRSGYDKVLAGLRRTSKKKNVKTVRITDPQHMK